jgi:hypothetical protein
MDLSGGIKTENFAHPEEVYPELIYAPGVSHPRKIGKAARV